MLAAFDPPGVVTTTLALPAVPAGVVAVMDVLLTTVTPVAAVPPMVTVVLPPTTVNAVPVIVTAVPPAEVPLVASIEATPGATGSISRLSIPKLAATVAKPAPPVRVNVVNAPVDTNPRYSATNELGRVKEVAATPSRATFTVAPKLSLVPVQVPPLHCG